MSWLDSASEWFDAHHALFWWLSAASIVVFLISPAVAAWLVTKLPADYFAQKRHHPLSSWDDYPTLRLVLLVAKSLLGVVLVLAGLIMLIAPGQGVLTIIVGLMLVEVPGKYRLEQWLATRRRVWRSLNWLRKRAGKPELKSPQ
jgi:hypothetical protein